MREAPEELLDRLCEHTRGFPRALEAVKAILDADPSLTPRDLLDHTRDLPEDQVVEALVAAKDRMAHSPLAQLTDREREVLSLMAQGMNNASIAKALFLTERAVEKHINSMFHKLGLTEEPDVHRRVMAVLAFLRESDHPA